MKLNVIISLLVLSLFPIATWAQDEEKKEEKKDPYQFTVVNEVDCTPVENQYRSGTCWSYSSNAFFESEMIRLGKEPVDFSEMFVVWHSYADKAQKYVRMHGKLNFSAGGAFHDVKYVLEKYGMIPEDIYTGLQEGEELPTHGEMDAILKAYIDAVLKNKNKKLSKAWFEGFKGILDAYLGKIPERFTYQGKSYTPQSFAKKKIGLNFDDYVNISSYTHHPFYSEFVLEIPDNWAYGTVQNLPIDEMMETLEYALKNDFSVAWGADVSEKGFSWRNGLAIVPDEKKQEMGGTEQERWEKLTAKEKKKKLYAFDKPLKEKKITQEMRQEAFDNYETTDDHGLQIMGIVKDQRGKTFYKVKNSWGTEDHKYDGYLYASEPFVAYKTMTFLVHKDGIPMHIRKKLGL